MKAKLYKFILAAFIGSMAMVGFSGCGDDITEQYYTGTEIETYYFTVKAPDNGNGNDRWVWNSDMGRYECIFDIPALSEKIYYDGMVQAAVLFWEGEGKDEYQTMKNLHFERTYWDDQTAQFYTEFINFDVTYNPSTICFYIETSNGIGYRNYLQDFEFKVNLMWDPNKR